MQLFISARLQLTAWYLLIVLLITGSVSAIVYFRTTYVIQQEYARIEQRILKDFQRIGQPESETPVERVLRADLALAKQQIFFQLLVVNGLIALLFAIAGYILSGKTLRPIQSILEEQQRLVADAAHELKTPITALKTSLEVNLMDKSLPVGTRKILSENLEDIECLGMLTESLLKLARFEHQQLDHVVVELAQLTKQAVKQITPLATKKSIVIKSKGLKKKYPVVGDFGALLDLEILLLDNAIKYSASGTTVTISLIEHRRTIELNVTDQGIGISKEHLAHIFNRFYRVDSSRTQSRTGGYGLGLAIAKKIVTQHKAALYVKSSPDVGTIFSVNFPKVSRVVIE
ncbi:MAG: HAMP domain-containing sensor histidine kinase [Microgenomates group bacterium]